MEIGGRGSQVEYWECADSASEASVLVELLCTSRVVNVQTGTCCVLMESRANWLTMSCSIHKDTFDVQARTTAILLSKGFVQLQRATQRHARKDLCKQHLICGCIVPSQSPVWILIYSFRPDESLNALSQNVRGQPVSLKNKYLQHCVDVIH